MEKLTLLCLIILSVSAVSLANSEQLTLECLKKYLSDRKVHEDLLSFVNPFVGSLTDCESAVKTKAASIHDNLRNRLEGNRIHRPSVNCVMRDIEEEDDESYELLVVSETAIEMISSWRFWSYWSKNSRLDDLRSASNRIVEKSLLKCKGHREFTEFFNNIQEKVIVWNRNGDQEYCIRTYLVKKGLLDEHRYKYNENPKHVQNASLNCVDEVSKVQNQLLDDLQTSKDLSNCYRNVYKENGYPDYVMKAEVLSKLLLDAYDKSRERQDFISALIDITYKTNKC